MFQPFSLLTLKGHKGKNESWVMTLSICMVMPGHHQIGIGFGRQRYFLPQSTPFTEPLLWSGSAFREIQVQMRCNSAHSLVEEKGKKGNHQNMRWHKIRSKWKCPQCVTGTQRKNDLTLSWDAGEVEFPWKAAFSLVSRNGGFAGEAWGWE